MKVTLLQSNCTGIAGPRYYWRGYRCCGVGVAPPPTSASLLCREAADIVRQPREGAEARGVLRQRHADTGPTRRLLPCTPGRQACGSAATPALISSSCRRSVVSSLCDPRGC